MDAAGQLGALLDLAEELGITIRRTARAAEPAGLGGPHGGSMVRLKGQEIIFLNTQASLADQIAAVAAALADRKELQDRFLRPEIRELISGRGG